MMMRRVCSAAVLGLLVGGCLPSGEHATLRPQAGASLEGMLDTTASIGGRGRPMPIVILPRDAGGIAGVKESRSEHVQRQDIALGTGAGNTVEVVAMDAEGGDAAAAAVGLPMPTEAGIREEIAARFPDLDMQVVTRSMRNAYGTFGLAIGKTARGERCIYAWQWIDNVARPERGRSALGGLFGSSVGAPVSLRVRLCRAGTTVDQLASDVERLSIRRAAIDPPARPVAASLEASLDGVQTIERDEARPEPDPKPLRAHAKRARRHHARRADSDVAGSQPDATATIVPPAGFEAGQPTRRPSYDARDAYQASPPGAVPAAGAVPRPLDSSLPAQAYLGPSGAKSGRGNSADAASGTALPALAERP